MIMRIYVSGSQYLATEVNEEEAQRIMSAFDNRETDRITVKQDGEIWNLAKAHIVAIAFEQKPVMPAKVTLN